MLLTEPLRLLGFTLGASLHIFLVVLLLRKRGSGLVERLALATLFASGLWHTASAVDLFEYAIKGTRNVAAQQLALAGLALAPSFLVHLGLVWAKLNQWLAAPAYFLAPVMWRVLNTGRMPVFNLWICVAIAWTAALCVYAARVAPNSNEQRFFRVFAGALLAIPVAGAAAGPQSAGVVLASLAPPVSFAWFIYRYNFLGLLISRRLVFVLNLGVMFALYLLLIRRVADYVEEEYEAFAALIELALIFAAALIWLPLYGWMTRFLSRRTQLYADFSKRLIEEAARILDLEKRLQFIAEEVGRSFALHKVCLVTAQEPVLRGVFGECSRDGMPDEVEKIKNLVRQRHMDVVNTGRSGDSPLRQLVARLGFNYLFPLWYEDRLVGLLFLDTSPKLFLDENEPILLGLSRQISHSIETCRVIEEKIVLERAMVRQEHLASLGKVAATIAHEIKNPLSSVKTLAQLMQEDPEVRERYARDLSYMIGETDRLNRSVQQLLSFSRPIPERQEEVDLTGLLETMGDLMARQYAGEQIAVERKIEPHLKLKHGNAEVIQQVVLNLMLNAVQASERDGCVLLEAWTQTDGMVCISVSDRGPGIPAGIQQKIFEPFFTTKQRGTGLGLAIVRKNVRHLGGEIHLESPIMEGRGTRVRVTLPAQ